MKRAASVFLLALVASCTTTEQDDGVGWKVDPNYRAPTTMQMFLYGPASEVETVIQKAQPLGWRLVEFELASQSALALVEGPIDPKPDAYIERIIGNRNVTFGPAFRPEERRRTQSP